MAREEGPRRWLKTRDQVARREESRERSARRLEKSD